MADLKILIQGQLQEKETESTIKSQLEQIQKNLKISIGTDDKQINDIAKQVKKLQDQLKNSKVSIIDEKDSLKIKNLEKDFDKVLNKYRQLGEVSFTKSFDPLSNQLEKFNLTVNKADGTVEKLKFELAELAGIKGLDNLFYMKDQSIVDNTAKLREKQLQDEQKINAQMDVRSKKQAKELSDLEHSVKLFQERSRLQVSGLVNSYGNNVNNAALEKYMDGLKNIPLDNVDLANKKMAELNLAYKGLSTNARIASKDTLDFGNMLGQAMTKFPIWMVASTA